jgi:hypothetical protein
MDYEEETDLFTLEALEEFEELKLQREIQAYNFAERHHFGEERWPYLENV